MSNKWFRYYDNRIAEGITITGQATIRWGENAINNYLNKVLKTNDYDYVIINKNLEVCFKQIENIIIQNKNKKLPTSFQ